MLQALVQADSDTWLEPEPILSVSVMVLSFLSTRLWQNLPTDFLGGRPPVSYFTVPPSSLEQSQLEYPWPLWLQLCTPLSPPLQVHPLVVPGMQTLPVPPSSLGLLPQLQVLHDAPVMLQVCTPWVLPGQAQTWVAPGAQILLLESPPPSPQARPRQAMINTAARQMPFFISLFSNS